MCCINVIKRVSSTLHTILTAQGPTYHFSSFQTDLSVSCCIIKKQNYDDFCDLTYFNTFRSFCRINMPSKTYVCGCAGSSPRVTLLPWISLKHFSQKWYLSATRPYLGELQPAHTVAAQANRRTGGRMQWMEHKTTSNDRARAEGRRENVHGHTHTGKSTLVTDEMIMMEKHSFKLKVNNR